MTIDPTIKQFLEHNHIGIISTSASRGVESAAVYYTFDDELCIYFNTRTNSRKYENIKERPEVAFTIYQNDPAQTLQVAGIAEEIADIDETKKIYETLIHHTLAKGDAPIENMHSMIRFIKITPTWARFGDFSHGIHAADAFTTLLGTSRHL
jgi:general stress protein 26